MTLSLEDAFIAARLKAETEELRKRPFDVVVYPADDKSNRNSMLRWHWNGECLEKQKPEHPNNLWIDETTTVIFKMHGSVWKDSDLWDNFVITEEDYLDFMSRMINQMAVPKIIADYFRNKSFLFLGYSLQDWNMRVISDISGVHTPRAAQSRFGSPRQRREPHAVLGDTAEG